MGHARHIGRVGALAVALGIGSAIAWPSGVAWAEPDTGTSVSPGGSGDTPSNTGNAVNRPSSPESTDDAHDKGATDAGDGDTDTAPPDEDMETPEGDDESPAPEVDEPEVTVSEQVSRPEGGADAPDVEAPESSGGDDAPRPTHRQRTVQRTAPVEKSTPVVAPNTATDTTEPRAGIVPVAPPPAPVVAAPTVTPAVEHDVTVEPAGEPAMTTALLSTLLLPGGTDSPAMPADSPLAWALLAFARRQGNQQSTRIGSGTPTVSTGELIDAADDDNTAPTARVVVGSPAWFTGRVTGRVIGSDADRDRLIYSGPTATAKGGTVVVSPTGRFTYTPTAAARHAAAQAGATDADTTDTFVVTVDDGNGGVTPVSVTVRIRPANARPDASSVVGRPDLGTGAVAGAIIADDPENDPLTFAAGDPAKGSVVINDDGSFVYTPTDEARDAVRGGRYSDRFDRFSVTVDDGHGGTDTITVTVAIASSDNAAPQPGEVSTGNPNAFNGAVRGQVRATDPDGDRLTFSGSTTTEKGFVFVTASGRFVYTPTSEARHAAAATNAPAGDKTDTFVVTIVDAYGGTAVVPVTVNIAPLNNAPTRARASASAPDLETGAVAVAVTARDADRDPLTYTPAASEKGAVVDNGGGSFTFTPTAAARQAAAAPDAPDAPDAARFETLTFTVADGHGGTTTTTVRVAIAPATTPTNADPTGGSFTAGQPDSDGTVTGQVSATDPDDDPLTYSGPVTSTKGGTVVVSADGSYSYDPTDAARHAASALGASAADKQDTFVVTVADGRGGTLQVPVTVIISPNNTAPQGSFSAGAPDTDGKVTGTITSTDADGDIRAYSGPSTSVKGGTITLDAATGAFTYKPTAAMREQATQTPGVDTDTFTVTVTDGHGGSTPVQVTVTIAPSVVTTASTPGIPVNGVIAAPGGGLYQVTTSIPGGNLDNAVTRVSVLTEDGRVLSTTADFAGFPSLPLAQPDGNLLVTVVGSQGGVKFVTVSPTGTLTPVLSLDGAALAGYPVVGANGTAYFLTAAPNGTYTLVGIAGDQGRTYQVAGTPGGFPAVGPDGTAYLSASTAGANPQTSVLVVRPDGTSTTTQSVPGRSTVPIVVSGGAAYLLVNDQSSVFTTTLVTVTGSTATTRTLNGSPGSQLIPSPDGSVLLTLMSYSDGISYRIARLTPAAVSYSQSVTGSVKSWPQVAPDGSAYLAVVGDDGTARLLVLRPGGASSVINLPGEFAESNLIQINAMTIKPDNTVYVPMVADDGDAFMAVVSPAGLVVLRSLDGHPVQLPVVGPDGLGYQLVETYDDETGVVSTHVAVLNGATTESLPGTATQLQGGVSLLTVAPDGTGLLIVTNIDGSVRGLAFDKTGATLGTFTDRGVPTAAVELGGLQGVTGKVFVFGADGTAYVTLIEMSTDEETGTSTPVKSSVYAMSSAGVTKVLEVPGGLATAPTVAPDGTVYVSTATVDASTFDGVTTVKVITPPSVL